MGRVLKSTPRCFLLLACFGGATSTSACGDSTPADDELGETGEGDGDPGDGDGEPGDGDGEPGDGDGDGDGESGDGDGEAEPNPYPEPDAWGGTLGPGAPTVSFAPEQLYQHCAYLDGGVGDTTDHHNLVVMFDGLLMMPWAPEWGSGGITFFNIADPCNPQAVGYGTSDKMRESHSTGFAELGGSWYAVVDEIGQPFLGTSGGIQLWDVSNTATPTPIAELELPGFFYPDAYARVTLSVFYQSPWIFVAGADNGVYVVDASDPHNPVLAKQYSFNPTHRAGQVQVIGNLLMVSAAEGPRTVMLDVSIPDNPQPIAGGDFSILDSQGQPRESYFSNWAGGYGFFALKDGGGGLLIYDLRDPSNPTFYGENKSGGNGGYVFPKDHLAFVGESSIARIYDWSDPTDVSIVAELHLEGDLDTVTPIGNIAVLSVDDGANPDQGSAIAPYAEEPDSDPPYVNFVWPPDGATGIKLSSRFGVSFNEMVEPKSAWEGSVRLYETDSDPALTRVEGWISTQEAIVNFAPKQPLKPGTSYTFEISANGIVDFNHNPVQETFTATFTTAG
ncbi:MAG: Ig-like domain-containing protein [Enhygromyxa sp.]